MKEIKLEDILQNTQDLSKEKKVWYVAVIWRPNAGKSTFLNTLIWEKISITSNVPQTTRKKVLAIYNDSDSQIVFFDTPWIHFENKNFNKQINNQAISSLQDSQVILYFIDSSRPYWEEEKYIEEILENISVPVLKVFTKTDLKSKVEIPENKENVFKISSNKLEWFEELIAWIKKYLPTWPLLFPENVFTKQDMFFRVSEVIREKVFLNTKKEIPHSIFIQVEEIEEDKTKDWKDLLKIVAYIMAESDSQKYILIWKSWALISKIWKEAREELEQIFWKKVFLALRVKVLKNWRKNEKIVKNILK